MKLLTKTSLYFFLLSIPVLLFAGLICYFMVTSEVRKSNDELLLKQKGQIENYLAKNDSIALQLLAQSDEATIDTLPFSIVPKDNFSDTMIYDNVEKAEGSYRLLTSFVNNKNGNFKITLWRSVIEFDELFSGIMTSLSIVLGFFFLAFFVINWFINRRLWKPFYKTVEALHSFRLSNSHEKIALQKSSVKEFEELNKSVNAMMEKLISDFSLQKQFTENASHEMQTPLSVIQSKIDLLIQSENFSEKETELITSIENALQKLSRLNKSLLLLTKIENRQFENNETISLEKIISDSLILFQEQIELKKITVTKKINASPLLLANAGLCHVLINNLLQNAIRHNNENGTIEIILDEKQFVISNSGTSITLHENKIVERFEKNSSSTESLGLGLSIAKEIAEAFQFSLNYKFVDGKHAFILLF